MKKIIFNLRKLSTYNVQYSKQRPTAESLCSDACLCSEEKGHIAPATLVQAKNGLNNSKSG